MNKLKYILIVFILILGFWLRFDNYTTWPRHGATFDEYAWTWIGIGLISEKVPISWSRNPLYKDTKVIKYQGALFQLAKPLLEQPPLFGLVAGSFAMLNGAKDIFDVTLENIRPLALILGVSSIGLLFLFVKEIYGTNIALLAGLLYATVPTIVIGSRIVQNENFLIPMWLLSLYFLAKYLKTGNKQMKNIAIFTAGILPMAKIPWIAASLSLSLIFAFKKRWKDSFFAIGFGLLVIFLFVLYGIYFDKDLFFGLMRFQMARYDLSFAGLLSVFTNPLSVDRYYLDSWIYFGFVSIFMLGQDFKKHIFVLFPFLSYLLIFVFAIPSEPGHGWYRYPFYPFLIIGISVFLKDYFIKNQLLSLLFFLFTGVALFQLTWAQTFGFSYAVLRGAILTYVLVLVPVFIASQKIKKPIKILNYLIFISFILMNIWAVLIYNEQ